MEKEDARRILAQIGGERCFWVNNGPVLSNLDELYKALSEMKKETFTHHVNAEKNDFAAWVKEVSGDQKLAEDLLRVKSKKGMALKIKQRIAYLKKAAA